MTGSGPDVYLEMMGDADEVDTYLKVSPLEEPECFLRVEGLPEADLAWIH